MALGMIAAFLLVAGGIKLSLARDTRARGILMMVAAAVLVVNVLVNVLYWYDGKRSSFSLSRFYRHWTIDLFINTAIIYYVARHEPYGRRHA